MIGKIANAIGLALIAWIAISYIDVVTHNLGNCTYAAWNLLVLLFGN